MANAGVGVGKLHIRGTIDTKDIENGFAKVKVGFINARKESQSTQTDLTKMDIIGKALGRTFIAVGVAATGMIGAAMAKAPALAGDMARIGVAWDRTIRALGVGLEPVFAKVSGILDGVANWAEAHPDIFAAVIGGAATITAMTGVRVLLKLLGLGPAMAVAATALAPFLAPVAAGTVLATLGIVAAMGIMNGITAMGGTATPVPIGDVAQKQIANAGLVESLDLQERYGGSLDSAGGMMTPEIDPATGRLVSNADVEKRIIQHAMTWLVFQNQDLSMRSIVLGQNNTYFNSTG